MNKLINFELVLNAMQDHNSIHFKDGNIYIKDIKGRDLHINPNDSLDTFEKLEKLDSAQIDHLLQIIEQQKEQIPANFIFQLNGVARQKNIVQGNITNVGVVNIGDKIHYHFHDEELKLPKELTLKLPKTYIEDIVGRDDDLKHLHQLINQQKNVVVVSGMGGIGKTTFAQTFIGEYYDDYNHIVWISQNSDNLISDFVTENGLVENLRIKKSDIEPEKLFNEIIRRLKAINDKPNLLIIDNAEQSLKTHLDILPNRPNWHLLVTSREEISGIGFYSKLLGFLSETNAVELFRKHYTLQKLNEQDIKELIVIVDYHTLTIEILAKTAQELRYDISELRKAIENDIESNLDVAHNRNPGEVERITSYLSTIFNLSRLNKDEIWLMKQFACLPNEFHTYDLLKDLLVNEENLDVKVFAKTLVMLSRKGWLLENKVLDSYKMHRIIAEVVVKQQTINNADIDFLIQSVSIRLNIDQSQDNPVDKITWIPFGKALLAKSTEDTSEIITMLQNELALMLLFVGDYQGAKKLLEKAVAASQILFGKEHIITTARYCNLGNVLLYLGDYQAAKILQEKGLALYEKTFGKDDPKIASSCSNLAAVLRELGEYQEAKILFKRAVALNEKNFGADHPDTAGSYSNLAAVFRDLGEYQDAKLLLEKAVASDEKNFGVDHPTTVHNYSNLGTVLKELGDYSGAKILLEKVVRFNEENFEGDHPTTATSYSNLATVLRYLGENQVAKTLHEKAIASDEKNFGEWHPTTAAKYSNLAMLLQEFGDHNGAKILLEKAITSDEKSFGKEHSITALRYSNLATVLQS
ncbi:MAG TPA: tetratricopeptide repeat protein, partial [Ferruginibacter sp.]|nr:tetratricopeptide repeat protein [Ferruginibacter sp.]